LEQVVNQHFEHFQGRGLTLPESPIKLRYHTMVHALLRSVASNQVYRYDNRSKI
jgi:hypothetical protein